MTGRIGFAVRAAATVLVALVLAHSLIFLAGYGAAFGHAMADTGHDDRWTSAAVSCLALGVGLLLAAAYRLRQLRRIANESGARRLPTEPDGRVFLRRWIAWWFAMTLAAAVLFMLQENLELARIGVPLPGIGVLLSAIYPNAFAIIVVVSLGVSLVAALFSWELELLISRIRAVQPQGRPRAIRRFGRVDLIDRRPGSILGRRLAVRAPPSMVAC
ncbi:MAG: hypothetical protein ABI978_00200 [Chloroflexota bacterium]